MSRRQKTSNPEKRFRCIDPEEKEARPYLKVLRGRYFSGKNDRQMSYIGRLHRDFMVRLEGDPDVQSYEHPSPPVVWRGGNHPFRFSYLTRSGHSVLADVQWRKTIDENDLTAFKPELEAAALKAGFSRFELLNDKQVHEGIAFERAQQIAPFTGEVRAYADEVTFLVKMARTTGEISIAKLAAAIPSERACGWILGAIGTGALELVNAKERITPSSLVRFSEAGR